MRIWWCTAGVLCLVFACLARPAWAEQAPNLIEDPSFEIPKERDQFGDGRTARSEHVDHSGQTVVRGGEKSRPGRPLLLGSVTRFVLGISDAPPAPLFVDNMRLERDASMQGVTFDGLVAFDFGSSTSPIMDGFWQITPGTLYSKGHGYGLQDARIWREFDALQPDPLYQDFVCIERGGLAVDVPNGTYRAFVNVDSPSGFWGEYQVYRERAIPAEGKPMVTDKMEFPHFQRKYFRFWNVEDSPTDNTFDKYQRVYFQEKSFDVEVTDGQLNIEFQGENWGCSVSAVVMFPVAKAAEGEAFLKYVEQKRRFSFDNYFKRVLHRPTGDKLQPTADDKRRGYVMFQHDYFYCKRSFSLMESTRCQAVASFVVVNSGKLSSLQPTSAILGNSFCCIATRVSV